MHANPKEVAEMRFTECEDPYSLDRLEAFLDTMTDHDLLVRQGVFLENLMKDVKELKDDQRSDMKDLDSRVRVLESFYWKLMGAAGVAGLFGGWLSKLIFK